MKRGGVIVYPTDTVWGIGCDATCSEAVRRIYEIKRRTDSKALICLVADEEMLRHHVGSVPQAVSDSLSGFDRPTTVIYPEARNVAPELLAPDGSIGIRVTSEEFSCGLCKALGNAVVSTSANISGHPAPAIFSEISQEILAQADYVAASRRSDTSKSAPSRVILITPEGEIKVLRQ